MCDSEYSLEKEVQRILGPDGPLVESGRYSFRPVQLEMALKVAQHLTLETPAVLESGTGTGKTVAYLLPLLLTGQKSVVATGTKTLQDQILYKDLPFLLEYLNLPAKVVCMKGRQNYLCKMRVEQVAAQGRFRFKEDIRLFERILDWATRTESGDRSELTDMPDDYAPWSDLTSSSENCLGQHCAFFNDCFITRMRRKAQAADLIIANHHLFFADLAVKRSNFGQVIPGFDLLVFDEAHLVESTATQYFGSQASNYRILGLCDDLRRNLSEEKLRSSGLVKEIDGLKIASDTFFSAFRFMGTSDTRFRINPGMYDLRLQADYAFLDERLNNMHDRLKNLAAQSLDYEPFVNRTMSIMDDLSRVVDLEDEAFVHWGEVRRRSVFLHSTPLDISEQLKAELFAAHPGAIFTSATLSTAGSFNYMLGRLGFPEETECKSYASPFDYQQQLCLYIPSAMPEPNQSGYAEALEEQIFQLVQMASGRSLVLFTSYAMLNRIHEKLSKRLPFNILKQGDAPRGQLLERFREDVSSVLFATGSFWQGVDVMGEALSCVIIDKLPFEPPNDPIVEARIEYLRKQGRNPFAEFQIPTAVIQLKQGVGRLIRDVEDWGVAAIFDKRMLSKSYGRKFMKSLPPGRILHSLDKVLDWWEEKNKQELDL